MEQEKHNDKQADTKTKDYVMDKEAKPQIEVTEEQSRRYSKLSFITLMAIVLAVFTAIFASAIAIINLNYNRVDEEYIQKKCTEMTQKYEDYPYEVCYSNEQPDLADILIVFNVAAAVLIVCIISFAQNISTNLKIKNAMRGGDLEIKVLKDKQAAILAAFLVMSILILFLINYSGCLNNCFAMRTITGAMTDKIMQKNPTTGILTSNILACLYVATGIIFPTTTILLLRKN